MSEPPKELPPEPPPSVEERLVRIEAMLERILTILGARASTGLGH